ncbi:MAG: DUF4292 domain-containing protein [Bacteroidales bacterium]|jgi:hypothetical protein
MAILLGGCSAAKYSKEKKENSNCIIKSFIENNISQGDFKITKAYIKVKTETENLNVLAYLIYKYPGSYIVSIKGKTGIEGLRGYISKDTLMINDRINRKIYEGSGSYLKEKYKISFSAIPVIFGDLIDQNNLDFSLEKNTNKENIWKGIIENEGIIYHLNCFKKKIDNAEIFLNDGSVRIDFDKYKRYLEKTVPTKIKIEKSDKNLLINIKISGFNRDEVKNFVFVPGKDYKQVILK